MRRVKVTDMWKEWARNKAERREEDKCMKSIKKRMTEGERLRHERKPSPLYFNGLHTLSCK
jgi:hypothetical protein